MKMDNYLDDIKMPFGKYKGEYIYDLPINYLEWLYENIELRGDIQEAVSKAIDEYYWAKSRRGRTVK
jgi:hypothetical protein